MRIGIDIDDTITNTYEYMTPYVCKKFNIDIESLEGKNGKYSEVYGIDKKEYFIFLKENFNKFAPLIPIKEDARKIINELKEKNEIIIITARNEEYFKDVKNLCIKYLKKENILFDDIIVNAKNKGLICKENKIDILIDDSLENCVSAKENNIRCIMFDSKINKNTNAFVRAHNWKEVKQIINEVK